MDYLHIKAIHIIFVTSWFAGLFYFPRLLVYHTEASQKNEPEKSILEKEYTKSEKLLMRAIMMPAMVLTLITGFSMVYINAELLTQSWMHLKLGFVVLVVIYHFACQKLMNEIALGQFRFTSFQLRLWNEVATILLFAIVFLVVLKNTIDWLWALLGLLIFSVVIMLSVRIVKKIKEKNTL